MDLVQTLYRLGGISDRATLVRLASRREFDRAVADGAIVRDGHGRYAVPVVDEARRAANALTGVVSHRSAALHWGWAVKTPPNAPDVTVPRNRNVPASRREGVSLHWSDLDPSDLDGPVTAPRRTLFDCLRSLSFDEALTVADSALRTGTASRRTLHEVAARVRGPGAPQARRVAREANARAANPFESVLRAISLDVPGLRFEPQIILAERPRLIRPDLVDPRLRLVAEAESFEWHGSRRALHRDCRRYTALVLLGWRVLRFSWEDVMLDPTYVRGCLATAVVDQRASSSAPPAFPA